MMQCQWYQILDLPSQADSRLERADFRSERADFRPERADSRLERADFRPERVDFRPDRADFRPDRADFRPERAWGRRTDGRTDEWTDGRTDGRTKVPLCSTGLRPLRGRCPASSHSNSQSCKAGQRVSLTTYCPWATCCFFCWQVSVLVFLPSSASNPSFTSSILGSTTDQRITWSTMDFTSKLRDNQGGER